MAAEISLNLNFEELCGDPERMENFKLRFIEDLAKQLGCDPSQIELEDLEPGSIKVVTESSFFD